MTPKSILELIGEPEGALVVTRDVPAPTDDRAHGASLRDLVIAALLPHFASVNDDLGLRYSVFEQESACILVEAPVAPTRVIGSTADYHGALVLDGRSGPAALVFDLGDQRVVLATDRGNVTVGTLPDVVAERIAAWSPPSETLSVPAPEVSTLLSDADVPAWLTAKAAELAAGSDVTNQVAAVGLVARHGPREAVQRAREWARTLSPDDVACIERWLDAECGSWEDALREEIDHPDALQSKRLIFRRDHLASLAAVRSLAGVGSRVHARLAALDRFAAERIHVMPADFGVRGDASLIAAGKFDPNAWWSHYAER